MVILSATSDHHTNSTVGLCAPYVELDDGGSYHHSPLQAFIWGKWLEYIEQLKALKTLRKAPLCTVFNGDIFDGDHHGTFQIITRNTTTMQRIAFKALEPLIEISDRIYVVRGTRAHVGGSAAREEEFAEDIGAFTLNENGPYSKDRLLLELEGVIIDFAHHTSMGRLPWTALNAANKVAAKMIFKCAENDERIPDLLFRSHNHRYSDSYAAFNKTRAVCLPAWQGVTEYVHRIDDVAISDIGGAIVECDKGTYNLRIVRSRPAPTQAEEVKIWI